MGPKSKDKREREGHVRMEAETAVMQLPAMGPLAPPEAGEDKDMNLPERLWRGRKPGLQNCERINFCK